ncbi:MAG: 16S rRNA (cytosine(1402)-N(4))-methyltransferase RsmH [Clostridiales bacterium]|nr:16S rRNA (cytosine(1402)-N(4))-methyltransferase RsmH [Clostridiales bacterium]
MYHVPVLLNESIEALRVKKNGVYFDGTLGGGGHSNAILSLGGRVIGVDRDEDAINECSKRLAVYGDRCKIIRANYKNADDILSNENVSLDGAILDLGISSHQIDTAERGMSYRFDAPLDMRMDRRQLLTAEMVVNDYTEDEIIRLLYEYGEEKFAKRIARNIVKARTKSPIRTTGELADIVIGSVPANVKTPQKRTFQAIRIEVNNELRGLDKAIKDIFSHLKSGARMCVITFHSLEDRIVKQTFNLLSTDCICDKSLPVCVCGHKAEGKALKKIKPSENELNENSRSASATLRVIEKL